MAAARSVGVQTVTVAGEPAQVLLDESHRAAMVCIGSRPVQADDAVLIGATVAALAKGAACPVAIVRSRLDGSPQTDGVVSVVLSDEADNDELMHYAMHEGRLRRTAVRLIDERTDSWVRRYPDVPVETVSAGTGRQYCRDDDVHSGVGLAVVGRRDAQELAAMTVPNCHPILDYPNCSILLVRS